MTSQCEPYEALVKIFTRINRFEHISFLAQWDARVNMPPKGGPTRGAAVAEVTRYIHDLMTDPQMKLLLDDVQAPAILEQLSAIEQANVREMVRLWQSENKLPADLVQKLKVATISAEGVWRKCRPTNDWAGFLPHLKEVLALTKEKATLLAAGTDMQPYEALMDSWEPGARFSTIDAMFADIKRWLPELLQKVLMQNKDQVLLKPQGPFAKEAQQKVLRRLMETWQFDFDAGRLDQSAHPFCVGLSEEVRLTTRFGEDDFDQSILGTIHETGHAKYEQNRGPRDLLTQPVSRARSFGVHESQSLFAEMQMSRCESFVEGHLQPILVEAFGEQPALKAANLVRHVQRVQPGRIRVDADELCYPLHVLIRYEIEVALFDGSLAPEDIPAAWDARMQSYLGLDTKGDFKDGPLQDTHWATGYIGFFPTYTFGAACAAQLMAACRRDLGDAAVDSALRTGQLSPVLAWQRDKIWSQGSLHTTDELLKLATGQQLDLSFYQAHLTTRYLHQYEAHKHRTNVTQP